MATTTLHVMTVQTKPMASLIQQNSSSTNCVIVNPQNSNQNSPKTMMVNPKRAIAPVESRTSVLMNNMSGSNNTDMLRCKRRINFAHTTHLTYAGLPGHQPASVARRNARERNRVKQVNNGFATLRSHIPQSVAAALSSPTPSSSSSRGSNASKKLSKVDTLRMAVEYIRSLKQMLDEHDTDTGSTTSSSAAETGPTDYYGSSPQYVVAPNTLASLSPPCSEASSSPTPSYASEGSGSAVSSYPATHVYQQENYENYEPMSPEDEELLDVISWWQQSQ